MNYQTSENQDTNKHQPTLGQNQLGYQWGSYLWAWNTTGFDRWELTHTSPNSHDHPWTWKGEKLKNQILVDSSGSTHDYGFPQPQVFLALSPWVSTEFPAHECLVSWNTIQSEDLVVGFWLQVEQLDQPGQTDHQDSPDQPWFCLGIWTSDPQGPRGSVKGQSWEGTRVVTDTLRSTTPFSRIRVGIEIKNRTDLQDQTPLQDSTSRKNQATILLNAIQLTWSTVLPSVDNQAHDPINDPIQNSQPCYLTPLPACSQRVYPDGGSVWCSPVSLAMVLEYWNQSGNGCKEIIFPTRDGVYDPVYKGYGNWVFNTAWAGQLGYRARVLRSGSLSDLEPWLDQGIPLILSVAWNQEKGPRLTGAPIESSNGHLTVVAGFDDQGNPLIHEPAADTDQEVVRTYQRYQLEQCWLQNSGGTYYAVYPESVTPPW